MKNIIITLILFFTSKVHAERNPFLKSSEFKLNQNGSSFVDLFAFGHLEKKIYKNFGIWSFVYADKNYAEIVTGPCYSSKYFTFGAGYGYEFIGKTIVLGATLKLNCRKINFTGYVEDSESWYWYYAELNKKIKRNYEIGIYNQALIGTGLQLKKNITNKTHLTAGLGYRQNNIGYNGSPIVGKFVLGANF